MKLPIMAYGNPVLKRVGSDITQNYHGLQVLIANMFETMYAARGVGLAAPQVGLSIRLFVIDATPLRHDIETDDLRKVFINARILEERGQKWPFNEGCLSVPYIKEDVYRHDAIRIIYHDENWQTCEACFTGLMARIIQHEHDHINGKLFTDRIPPLRKKLLEKKLNNIAQGNVRVDYGIRFSCRKKYY